MNFTRIAQQHLLAQLGLQTLAPTKILSRFHADSHCLAAQVRDLLETRMKINPYHHPGSYPSECLGR